MIQASHSRFGFMFHVQMLLHSAGMMTDSAFHSVLVKLKRQEARGSLLQKGDRNSSFTWNLQVKSCAKPVLQSFAAELTTAESFLLRAEDDTVTAAKKS